jgi:hypothetical protein
MSNTHPSPPPEKWQFSLSTLLRAMTGLSLAF